MGGSVALDTSVAIAALNGDPSVVEKLRNASRICLPLPVVGELLFGARKSQRAVENLERVMALIGVSEIIEMGLGTASIYSEVKLSLKSRERPIPENDVWIGACCLERGMSLLANDAHFGWIDGLKDESA